MRFGRIGNLLDGLVGVASACGCCGTWARHLTAAGFSVSIVEVPDIAPIKAEFGVPYNIETCHTAKTSEYAIEGHL